MDQIRLEKGPLLDEKGALMQRGYATSLARQYDRKRIAAGAWRIKEWDYYLVYCGDYAVALTLADNGYMDMVSASLLDFRCGAQLTVSPIGLLPLGRIGMPADSAAGDAALQRKNYSIAFRHENGKRHLTCRMKDFGGHPFEADLWLSDEPRDSMVIATPFAENPKAFYYNQKILAMRAEGFVRVGDREYVFDPARSMGLLDWGRGVWTYQNTWYWSAAQGKVKGHSVGFNLGYGFGDTSAATENMLFVDGIAHKLQEVTFHIPKGEGGKEDYLAPWTFSSSDGRFEAEFLPIMDRASLISLGVLKSDQHQVFGRFNGRAVMDDGTIVPLQDLLGFAEKVYNKW